MNHNTIILYLTGKPGVGKYTIAKEIAKAHSFIVCDNQLINNPIFELLQYDGYAKIPDFAWDTIARIRTEVFDFLAHHTKNSYVLTNCLADTQEDRELYGQVEQLAQTRGSLFIPVQIQISKEEHLKRLTRPERRQRWKSIDPSDAEDNGPLISIANPNLFSLNVSNLSPEDAAEAIMNHIKNTKPEMNMKTLKHTTAKASYYNTRAECYDEFNENNSKAINALLEKILKEHQVATVLDLTCGTGSQVFWLQEKGFEIVGSDISQSMLKIAKQKAKLKQLKIMLIRKFKNIEQVLII